MKLGNVLRTLRKKKGIMQKDFCKTVGVTPTYLSLIERERVRPNVKALETIAAELQVPLPLIFWLALERGDVKETKRPIFDTVKPMMDNMVGDLIN